MTPRIRILSGQKGEWVMFLGNDNIAEMRDRTHNVHQSIMKNTFFFLATVPWYK